MDLFEHPELLPKEVQDIIDKYSEMDTTYESCQNLVDDLEKVGYTCDYGLDGVPYELKKLEEEFEFYLDQKHTIWYRNRFTITAKNLDEAKAKVKELYGKEDLPSDDWETLFDTLEGMTPSDNGGEPTDELFTHDGELVLTNKP